MRSTKSLQIILHFVSGLLFLLIKGSTAAIVNSVECQADLMKVLFNPESPEIGVFSEAGGATVTIKGTDDESCKKPIPTAADQPYEIPLNSAKCGVEIVPLEPDFSSAQATLLLEETKTNYKVELLVYCLFKSLISGSLEDAQSNPEALVVKGNTVYGGATGTAPEAKVILEMQSEPGRKATEAGLGDLMIFNITLVNTEAYRALQPQSCRFFDAYPENDPKTKSLTFIQDGCPLPELSDIVTASPQVSSPVTFVANFVTFKFKNTQQLYVQCTVKICTDVADCEKTCPLAAVDTDPNEPVAGPPQLDVFPASDIAPAVPTPAPAGPQENPVPAPTVLAPAPVAGTSPTLRKKRNAIDKQKEGKNKEVELYSGLLVFGNDPTTKSPEPEKFIAGIGNIKEVCVNPLTYWGMLISLIIALFFLLLSFVLILFLLLRHRSKSYQESMETNDIYSVSGVSGLSSSYPAFRIPRANYPVLQPGS